MILFLHNRYRTTGGEERAVADLMWLVREHLGEDAELVERDSAALGHARAALGMLRGGLQPDDVAAAVRRTRARVVHAHNVNPSLGWRGLAAARAAGARIVLHLHNYRLVCAVAVCFNSRGEDCTRCRGRNTLPGVRLNCRGTGPEALVYAAALAAHQRRLVALADTIVVPSAAAAARLAQLRAPLDPARVRVVPHVVREFAAASRAADGAFALVASRLAREKGVATAIDACRDAGLPLVVAGDGPEAASLRARAGGGAGGRADLGHLEAAMAGEAVRFVGTVGPADLAQLRTRARVAVVPTYAAETFGLAALEAMAAGVPVVASAMGALTELADDVALVPPGDVAALTAAIRRVHGDTAAGERGIAAARARVAPDVVAPLLAAAYEDAR